MGPVQYPVTHTPSYDMAFGDGQGQGYKALRKAAQRTAALRVHVAIGDYLYVVHIFTTHLCCETITTAHIACVMAYIRMQSSYHHESAEQ